MLLHRSAKSQVTVECAGCCTLLLRLRAAGLPHKPMFLAHTKRNKPKNNADNLVRTGVSPCSFGTAQVSPRVAQSILGPWEGGVLTTALYRLDMIVAGVMIDDNDSGGSGIYPVQTSD
jgi:hypothetical protein